MSEEPQAEVRRVYPAWMGDAPYTASQTELAETLGRIANRTEGWKRERDEQIAALAWCRANGNPHLANQKGQDHE